MDENPYEAPREERPGRPLIPIPPIKRKSIWPTVLALLFLAFLIYAILAPAFNVAR
jgi:hypothetical protein